MKVKILLPYKVFFEGEGIRSIVLEAPHGSLGVLPHRLDCVTPLAPGLLSLELGDGEKQHFAVDEGVFTKSGNEVFISVRNAVSGKDIHELKDAVRKDFKERQEKEAHLKEILSKLESGIVQNLKRYTNDKV